MEDALGEVFFLLPFALIIGLAAVAIGSYRRRFQRWLDLGPALGLAPQGEPGAWAWYKDWPDLRGSQGGFDVRVRTYTTGSGKQQTRWTAVEVPAGSRVVADLRVTREGWGTAIAKALGGQDVETGDPAFDPAFRVRAHDPDRARRLLTAEVRLRVQDVPRFAELRLDPPLDALLQDPQMKPLLDLLHVAAGPDAGEATVRYVRQELVTDPEQLRPAIAAALALADAVRREAPPP